MTLLQDRSADTDHPVLDVIAERWSTRVFDTDTPLDEGVAVAARSAPPEGAFTESRARACSLDSGVQRGRSRS